MADELHFYEDAFIHVSSTLETYVGDTAANVIDAITPMATNLLAIYVMLWGWSMMRGLISEPVTDGLARILTLTTIIAIALNIGRYNTYLADWLWKTPEALGKYIVQDASNAEPSNNMVFLDGMMTKYYQLGSIFWESAYANSTLGFPDMGFLFFAICLWGVGLVVTLYAAFLFFLAKIALAAILAFGPIFILITLFEPTKRFFQTWLSQALTFMFVIILCASVLELIFTLSNERADHILTATATGEPRLTDAILLLGLAGMGILVLAQVQVIASGLGGGVALSTLGAVNLALDKVKGGVAGLRPTNMRRSVNKLKADYRITRNAATSVARAPKSIYNKITGANRNRISRG